MATQGNRILYLTTPLGKDVLMMSGFSGTEGVSRLFNYQVNMVSEKDSIGAKDIVGKSISWKVQFKDGPPRFYGGYVSRFTGGGLSLRGLRTYHAQVVPWLWMLTRTADCRIWPPGGQKKSAPEIIQMLFDELGFASAYEPPVLKGTHPKREYCVQYRETAFNFVSRLMEEEGIAYYFKHEDGAHKLVWGDDKSIFKPLPADPVSPGERVDTWEHQYEFRPGKWARTDYNFETPSTSLLTTTETVLSIPDAKKYEMFDYPGDYLVKGDGTALTKVRMEEDEVPFEVTTGTSVCAAFAPGGKFTLNSKRVPSESGKGYVVTSIQHMATDADFESSGRQASYSNVFQCIPDTVTFRPARTTPKPLISGAQTAVVVGKKGEEIYTDKYGRVKVQFFWDRKGTKDENSSCWIRVSENWAGKNWGIIFNPRIGQEVIVEFLEGDPDRPIITGRVYNAEQMPPYDLPANQTQSTIKSRSSKEGTAENFNELRFEDKKGKEEIYFHAEKDFNRVVENNDTLKVGAVKKDKGDQTIEIFNNQVLKIGSGEGQAADGSQTITVYKDRTETVKTGNEKVTVEKGNRDIIVSTGNDKHVISKGNREVEIAMGNDTLTIKMGNRTTELKMGNMETKLALGNTTTKLDLGKSETEAMQSIELKVGQSSIKVDQTGVTIKGMMIKVEGQIMTEVKGLITKVEASALLKAKGAITMIG